MIRKAIHLTVLFVFSCLFSLTAMAQSDNNGAPSGKHYNLNIIGVDIDKAKKTTLTNSNRHTIFMPISTSSKGIRSKDPAENGGGDVEIHAQIWLHPGDTFRVCDGNGFDEAYGCLDNPYYDFDETWNGNAECYNGSEWVDCYLANRKEGAVFELPCNNGIAGITDIDCDGSLPQASYTVWARVLGSHKNDPSISLTTCATVSDELQCSTENYAETRTQGKSMFTDVTSELTSAVVDYCTSWSGGFGSDCLTWETKRIALFAGETEDWFWNYVNDGVKLLQIRFYD